MIMALSIYLLFQQTSFLTYKIKRVWIVALLSIFFVLKCHAQDYYAIDNLIINPNFKGVDTCCDFGPATHHIPGWIDYSVVTIQSKVNYGLIHIGVLNNYYPKMPQEFAIATLLQPLQKEQEYLLSININDHKKKLLLYFFTDTPVTSFMDTNSSWLENQKIDTIHYYSGSSIKIKVKENSGKHFYFALLEPNKKKRFVYFRKIFEVRIKPLEARHYMSEETVEWVKHVYRERRKHYFLSPCNENTFR